MLKLNWHVKTEECDKGYVTEPVFQTIVNLSWEKFQNLVG